MADIDQVRHWRLRATELRTIAEQFSVPSAQDTLRRLAARCDQLADEAEHKRRARARRGAVERSPG